MIELPVFSLAPTMGQDEAITLNNGVMCEGIFLENGHFAKKAATLKAIDKYYVQRVVVITECER